MQIKTTMRYYLTTQNGYHPKKQKITSIDEDVEKKEPSCTAGVVNWERREIRLLIILLKITRCLGLLIDEDEFFTIRITIIDSVCFPVNMFEI